MPLLADSVHIWRTPDGHHHLHWETSHLDTVVDLEPPSGAELEITTDPGAPYRARVSGLAANERHYFRLRDGLGTEVLAAARGLGLPGGVNFRDAGGYLTDDGHRVRWGRLFRSGSLAQLSPEGVARFADLGVDLVCDFRREDEQVAEPSRLPERGTPGGPEKISLAITPGSQAGAFYGARASIATRADMFEAMCEVNREFVESQSHRYAEMFAHILSGPAERVLVHCAAGKDRTGFAVALLLSALRVPRATIMRDYLLTRHYFNPADQVASVRVKYGMAHLGDEVLLPMLTVEEAYLDAALALIDSRFGGVERYLSEVLGVGEAERRTLAERFLERV